MSLAHRHPMTIPEFLDWEAGQEEKWEFVDGEPVLRRVRMMAGGTRNHVRIGTNLILAIGTRLRGKRCAPIGPDLKVVCPSGAVRYPDVMIECAPAGQQLVAGEVRAAFEVVSASNTPLHQTRLLVDYQSIETMEAIAFVSQTAPYVQLWLKAANGWAAHELEGMGAVATLPAFGIELPFTEIYDGVVWGS